MPKESEAPGISSCPFSKPESSNQLPVLDSGLERQRFWVDLEGEGLGQDPVGNG